MTAVVGTPSTSLAPRLRPAPRRPARPCAAQASHPEAGSRTQQAPAAAPPPGPLQRLGAVAAAGVLSAALALAPAGPGLQAHAQEAVVSNDAPVLDLARVVPSAQLEGLQQRLKDLER